MRRIYGGKNGGKEKKDAGSDRREFLKGSAVSVAAAGVVVVAGKSVSANEVDVPQVLGTVRLITLKHSMSQLDFN